MRIYLICISKVVDKFQLGNFMLKIFEGPKGYGFACGSGFLLTDVLS